MNAPHYANDLLVSRYLFFVLCSSLKRNTIGRGNRYKNEKSRIIMRTRFAKLVRPAMRKYNISTLSKTRSNSVPEGKFLGVILAITAINT